VGVEQATVRSVVENFGHSLKSVSLLSSTASQDIETNYKDFLDPALLAQWKVDPSKAVGRLTSSPWPDRIEIAGMVKIDQGVYEIFGKIIDMTSMGMAGSRPIDLNVTKINVGNFDSRWLITKVSVIANQENELWKHYNDNGISFQYPEKLTTQYVFAQEWPPAVKIQSGIYSCTETPQEISSMSDITSERMVDDRTYCVNIKNEGAAGSVYSSYVYTTAKNGKLVNVSFTLQYPNCNNYDEVQRKACTSGREAFDIDSTVDRIFQSIVAKQEQKTLAEELRDCLPKSDTASHEKCNELLKQITDYDSCVNAGFSIMKSNPPQCATPDGRTFIQAN
jgi:hypothetical protein